MDILGNISETFKQGLKLLGFEKDDAFFLVNQDFELPDPQIIFHLENAKQFNATAIYIRKQLSGSYKPQVYIFDFTHKGFDEQDETEVIEIQKKIWSSGEVPVACLFYNTEIKIIDCTKHLTKNYKPEYLVSSLKLVGRVHELYNEEFAVKIKSGIFWEQEELKNKFKFQNSSYDKLIENIRFVVNKLTAEFKNTTKEIVKKIIVQSILIKYLEERIDNDGNKLLSEKYFQKYNNSSTFNDVLINGNLIDLLDELNNDFNGNVFNWSVDEKKQLKALDLSLVADLLATNKADLESKQLEIGFPDWRYFEFKFIPVELISRLYEEFLGENKKEKGLFYTPSHLAKLLIDECLPLKKYKDIDLNDFTILDPACGSGIFLVVAFKRLVQIWRLKNKMIFPDINDLKLLLKNIYGVDKEEQAVRLASFSLCLALCNELNPLKIINELKFDDLREQNLIQSDFFKCHKIHLIKFDLIIGNPPFVRGSISEYSKIWEFENNKVVIPQGQIALKFLSDSITNLKEHGLVCLIIKSSGLLYNTTSSEYKKVLFSNFNVIQILDFTCLARNKSLWDNGADVASAAIFIRNESPEPNRNILHLTFRRTKATKERIIFEIDDYDLHFVNRQTAITNDFVWKNNLLGGGRIKTLVDKFKDLESLNNLIAKNSCTIEEGFEIGSKQNKSPRFIYEIPTLPTLGISYEGIDYNSLGEIDNNLKFSKVTSEHAFRAPNLIIWENLGGKRFPIFKNEVSFSFQRRIISISSIIKDLGFLNKIYHSFENFYSFYKFYLLATSSETLINRNNTFLLKDLKSLPFIFEDNFSTIDNKVIDDCINYQMDFFIHGEQSKSLYPIQQKNINSVFQNYGTEFSRAMNIIYGHDNQKFRLSDVVVLDNSLIASIFRFDSKDEDVNFTKDLSELKIECLTKNLISSSLTVNRIVRIYPQKDMIVFVKPNQYRYWISLIAYRDADKCFMDFSKTFNE